MRKVAIIGAGLSGATIARQLLKRFIDLEITIYEKNSVIGGNLRENLIDGTIVHEHGPHIFHTKSKKIWKFIETLRPATVWNGMQLFFLKLGPPAE